MRCQTRTSEISSEVLAADWLPGHAPRAVGARFRGRNRSGLARWTRVCEIVAATRGSSFSFRTVPERFDLSRRDSATWSFELRPERGGTMIVLEGCITGRRPVADLASKPPVRLVAEAEKSSGP